MGMIKEIVRACFEGAGGGGACLGFTAGPKVNYRG